MNHLCNVMNFNLYLTLAIQGSFDFGLSTESSNFVYRVFMTTFVGYQLDFIATNF